MADDKSNKKMKIETPKGRPLLRWVNKHPLEYVSGFPTQLTEVFDPQGKDKLPEIPKYNDLEKNWHNLLFHGDNKEVLATLLELGFRGQVDLIYIDQAEKRFRWVKGYQEILNLLAGLQQKSIDRKEVAA